MKIQTENEGNKKKKGLSEYNKDIYLNPTAKSVGQFSTNSVPIKIRNETTLLLLTPFGE